MDVINPGEVINKFVGKMVGCGNCNGYFRITSEDVGAVNTRSSPPSVHIDWINKCHRKMLYYIKCPTKGCSYDIDFYA